MGKYEPANPPVSTHKSMSLSERLVSSIQRNGVGVTIAAVRRHASTLVSKWIDQFYDSAHSIETAGVIETPDLVVVGGHKERGIRYEPTRARPFRRQMRALGISCDGVFVDIGSGKGRVLVMAAEYGFNDIVGVDYAGSLCAVARENFARVHQDKTLLIHHCDAADYEFAEGETVVYLYNPFDAVVMEKMMKRLNASLRKNPRKAWVIYHHPLWKSVIEAGGMFKLIDRQTFGGCEFATFVHDPL